MQHKTSYMGKAVSGLLLTWLVMGLGCAGGPAPRPTVAGLKKVLLVGFPGQVYDHQNKAVDILTLAQGKLTAASEFVVEVDKRDLHELDLVTWGRGGEACLTFKMGYGRDSATVAKDRLVALAQKKQVDAVMVGGFKLYKTAGYSPGGTADSEGTDGHLALRQRDMGGKALRLLGDTDSGVILEAILVAADGSCRWHGHTEATLGAVSGLKSLSGVGLISPEEIAYERVTRGLSHLFLTLPKR